MSFTLLLTIYDHFKPEYVIWKILYPYITVHFLVPPACTYRCSWGWMWVTSEKSRAKKV